MKYLPQTFLSLFFVVGILFLPKNIEALTLAPARLEIIANPGDTYIGELKILNEQTDTITFYSSFENFEASGDTGTPNFIKATEGLATWISSESSITLNSGEERTVPFEIKIPQNARPGGHFAAIFWGTTPVAQKGLNDISVGARIGALVLLRVSGEIKEGGGVTNMTTESGEVVFSKLPITFSYDFNNTGDDRLSPSGEIEVRNTFGIKVATLNANEGRGNILPQSTRKFKVVWGEELKNPSFFKTALYQLKNPSIGYYKATVKLSYGQEQLETKDSVSIFVIPWQILSIIVFILLLVWALFVRIVKQRRRMLRKQKQLEEKIKKLEEIALKNILDKKSVSKKEIPVKENIVKKRKIQ